MCECALHLRACAKDNAHKRKYDAVCDTEPKTNSIVCMP